MTKPSYCHSGSLGDIIYALPVCKHFGKGDFFVKLHSIEYTTTKYGYRPEHVSEVHRRQLTVEAFNNLAPLLESQPYINAVVSTDDSALEVMYDLDKFRGVMWRTFEGNYLESYFKTFNIPYTAQDIITPWLIASKTPISPIIVTRTFRYRNLNSEATWQKFTQIPNFSTLATFVGLDDEYEDFKQAFNVNISHYKPKDFLDLACVINAADHIISNQTFVYSLAQGLGKATSLECIPDRPLARNECYFPRPDNYYF